MNTTHKDSSSEITSVLKKYLPFSLIHVIKVYHFNLSTVNSKNQPLALLNNLIETTQKLLKGKRILFYPEPPKPPAAIYQICLTLGYKVITDPKAQFDLCFKCQDATFSPRDSVLASFVNQNIRVINIDCEDISKSQVDQVFESVFGYSLKIDPLTYQGKYIVKSNLNCFHDGKIMTQPLSQIKPGFIYQKLVDNEIEGNRTLDIRVPIFKDSIPFVYLKERRIDKRFGGSDSFVCTKVASANSVFSEEEIQKMIRFCQKMGLEYGELDVLRDKTDGLIYIVDANNTPSGTILKPTIPEDQRIISFEDRILAIQKRAEAFQKTFIELA